MKRKNVITNGGVLSIRSYLLTGLCCRKITLFSTTSRWFTSLFIFAFDDNVLYEIIVKLTDVVDILEFQCTYKLCGFYWLLNCIFWSKFYNVSCETPNMSCIICIRRNHILTNKSFSFFLHHQFYKWLVC